jgi:serine/threonine protein kinase/Tfp pilus assembly protein PilF
MGLSTQEMTRLGQLLDQSLPLPPAARRAWLEALPGEDRPLVHTLREALMADDPETVADSLLDQPPRLDDAGPAAESPTRQAGERLGAYELLRPLGAGGMAEVWLARRADGAFERQVALKIPRLRDMPAEMAERFARECRILATLECPGIARLYDAGVDVSGVPYIAMEYVQGEPLTTWCDARDLGAAQRIGVFLQVLEAVSYAHARQIIHRDLKPSNILLTEQGEARLLDFGVARLLQVEPQTPSLTRNYGRALTPEYASPEVLRSEPIDLRSDIYSLGVVLHELLTGARPGQPIPPPSHGRTELRGALLDVVRKALANAPADRYADAASFAAALRQAIAPAAARPRWREPRIVLPAALLLLVVASAALLYQTHARNPAPATPPSPPAVPAVPAAASTSTIAVLPFVDLSERQDQGVLSDGLAEELLSLLTKIPELRVTARASSFAFRDHRTDVPAIGRQLNVANILDGSVRKSGNRLRFAVQLVQASTGTVVWSETYDREIKDVFKLQEDVAGKVVEALKVRLLTDQRIPPAERTTNVAAYEQYLLGLKYRENMSLDDKRKAMAAFEQAVALDPTFARGYAASAAVAVDIGGSTVDRAMYERARARAERAIAISPRLSGAYVARAFVRMHNDWDFAGARADLDIALGIDPNSMGVQQLLSSYLMITGKLTEALAVQQSVVERNPLSGAAWNWLAESYLSVGDYPNARAALKRATELMSDTTSTQQLRALIELRAGNYPDALRYARLIKEPHFRDFAVAMAAWSAGQTKEAQSALQRLIDQEPDVFAAQIAMASAWQGNQEQTFRWLDHALDLHDAGLMNIKTEPEFAKFRGDPRFEAALKRMNLL